MQRMPSVASIEITPGTFTELRGQQEIMEYLRQDRIASTECPFCCETIYSVDDAAMVLCPACRSIVPTTPTEHDGQGFALGFSAHDWPDLQREALGMAPAP